MRWLDTLPLLALTLTPACTLFSAAEPRPPNIVVLLANDLGYAELGCYGQRRITTRHLDRLAAGGMRFTQAYAGSNLAAPSQASLLTGMHTGHGSIRDQRDQLGTTGRIGQTPLPAAEHTLAEFLRERDFVTAAMGSWALGGDGTVGHPIHQGFDSFFGYLCQVRAEQPYPTQLWHNTERLPLPGNADGRRRDFAQDRIVEQAEQFLGQQTPQRPFFLFLTLPSPGPALQVPADSMAQYKGLWHETPYREGDALLQTAPRAAHAARITRTDEHVGRLLAALQGRSLLDDTLILFTSLNGPGDTGGIDTRFFASTRPLRGGKGSMLEGGLRVPLIAHWPARIAKGRVSHQVTAAWDLLPTIAELLDAPTPPRLDGISLAPTLLGRPTAQPRHGFLYWERAGQQAIRMGRWKAMRHSPDAPLALFDLVDDISESQDLAARQSEVIQQIELILSAARTPSKHFPLRK